MRTLNVGLMSLVTRWHLMSGDRTEKVFSTLKVSDERIQFISTLSSYRLNILNNLPVSVFKIDLSVDGDGLLYASDSDVGAAGFRAGIMSELMMHNMATNINPILLCGLEPDKFNRFMNQPLEARMSILLTGEFRFLLRLDLDKFIFDDDSCQSKVINMCSIFSADLDARLNGREPDDLSAFNGSIEGYALTEQNVDGFARQMFSAGFKDINVVSVTKLREQRVRALKRRVEREGLKPHCKAGRTMVVDTIYRSYPGQTVLFLLLYRILVSNPTLTFNAPALMEVYAQYQNLMTQMDIPQSELMDINCALVLARALRNKDVVLRRCPSCRTTTPMLSTKPSPCPRCSHAASAKPDKKARL